MVWYRLIVHTFHTAVTLMLSFALFPKEGNWRYAVGSILVLGGLTIASLDKQRNKRRLGSNQQEIVSNGRIQSIDDQLLVPVLASTDPSETANLINHKDHQTSEYNPGINKDIELGRSLMSGNGPERRR